MRRGDVACGGGTSRAEGVSDVDSPNENLQMAARRPEAMITARIAAGRRCR